MKPVIAMMLITLSINAMAWEVENPDSLHNGLKQQEYKMDHPNELEEGV